MKKVLILGGRGYFANHFANYFRTRWPQEVEFRLSLVDIADIQELEREILEYAPDIVLNAAGKTGKPNVDWCEDHKFETYRANVFGALNVMNICLARNIYMVHLGSGCVYTGDAGGSGFTETDRPNFFGSFYSRTKAISEAMLQEFPVLQLRIRMPIEGRPNSRNLITKLVNYRRIISVPNSATVVEDFLPTAWQLIQRGQTGIFNMTNTGSFTHEQILRLYQEIVDPNYTFEVISLESLGSVVKAGRSNCVLNTDKLVQMGLEMPPITTRLRQIMEIYKSNLDAVEDVEPAGCQVGPV